MWQFLESVFSSSLYAPHGFCFLWAPELIFLHVLSDATTAIAYFSIPFVLATFVAKRSDVEFGWVFWAFAVFITACGMTHVLSIYTLWVPVYGIEGLVKAITAVASITTAALLWPLLPKLLTFPSPSQLRQAYVALAQEERQRREVEDTLRRSREAAETEAKLQQSQKMQALGQLTGGIAHDFNNILTVITGTIELLAETVADRPQAAKVTRLIDAAATRGSDLVKHLLSFARQQPLQPKTIAVNDLVLECEKLLQPTLGTSIKIETELDRDLPKVLVDPSQLTSAIVNLALNARDAMPSGGKLHIRSYRYTCVRHEESPDGDLHIGNYVVLELTDTGSGIPKSISDRIFEPFFSTKAVGAGSGLGLSMVHGFIIQSHGHIKVSSEENKGTTVSIYLPEDLDSHSYEEEWLASASGGNETVLIVEDDPLVREVTVTQAKGLGYTVYEASHAEEALEILAAQPGIDLLLTDVIMADSISGTELAESARQMRPSIRVLYMSGYSEDEITHSGRLNPGVLLLSKPFHKRDLAAMMRRALASSIDSTRPVTPSEEAIPQSG